MPTLHPGYADIIWGFSTGSEIRENNEYLNRIIIYNIYIIHVMHIVGLCAVPKSCPFPVYILHILTPGIKHLYIINTHKHLQTFFFVTAFYCSSTYLMQFQLVPNNKPRCEEF